MPIVFAGREMDYRNDQSTNPGTQEGRSDARTQAGMQGGTSPRLEYNDLAVQGGRNYPIANREPAGEGQGNYRDAEPRHRVRLIIE